MHEQSSAITRSQATLMQFPYNLASYQGCLHSGLGTRLYTQSAWTGFNPYYPVSHCQNSGEVLGSRQELPTLRILYVSRYVRGSSKIQTLCPMAQVLLKLRFIVMERLSVY